MSAYVTLIAYPMVREREKLAWQRIQWECYLDPGDIRVCRQGCIKQMAIEASG